MSDAEDLGDEAYERERVLKALEGLAETLQLAASGKANPFEGVDTTKKNLAESKIAAKSAANDEEIEAQRHAWSAAQPKHIYSEDKDPRGPICEQKLTQTRRLVALPNMTTLSSPIAMNMQMCGLKATCCSVKEFNSIVGQTEKLDFWVDSLMALGRRFETYPTDVMSMMLSALSEEAFTTTLDAGLVYKTISSPLWHLISDISNRNLAIHTAHLVTELAGYFEALLCSSCDPAQKLYVQPNSTASRTTSGPSSSSPVSSSVELVDKEGLVLTIDNEMCFTMGSQLVDVMERLRFALLDYRNVDAMQNMTLALCDTAEQPLHPGKFPRKGKFGCLQMKKDFDSLCALAESYHGPFVGVLGCNSAASCGKLICEDTLQGMAFSYEKLANNIRHELEEHCVVPKCNPYSLQDYVDYFLPSDAKLEKMGYFTKGGPQVSNRIAKHTNETRLDLVRFGCSGYLSHSGCLRFDDVTFASAHIEVIVIASSIAGVVIMIFGLLLWHRWRNHSSTWSHSKLD